MTKQTAFRIPDETLSHLDEMARVFGTNRTAFLCAMIENEYQTMQGNPQLRKMLDALRECADIMRAAGVAVADPYQVTLDAIEASNHDANKQTPLTGSPLPEGAGTVSGGANGTHY